MLPPRNYIPPGGLVGQQAHTYNPNNPQSGSLGPHPMTAQIRPKGYARQYSLAEVQLKGGTVVGMTITAGHTLGDHLTKAMKETGFLYLYNDNESMLLRAEEVVAVRLTKLTTQE